MSVTAKTAAAGATSTVFAAPAIVHAQAPEVKWPMATSWPPSLDTLFGATQYFAERVGALTSGKFKITAEPAGKLSKGTDILDVVSQGAVPIGHTASYYYVGKSPVTAFGTALPFGMTAQQNNAWFYEGGGLAKLQDFYARKFGVIQWPAGNTGAQMGGWFRKPINTVNDLKGLKMRIPGIGGQVMKKLGVNTITLPGGEIFQALQTGAIDATEWVGPYDDEKLGFHKVAKNYYYPGWWEAGPTVEIEINLREWNKLPKVYQEAIKSAAAETNVNMLARYEARNNAALKRLLDAGVTLQPYSKEILDAAKAAADELYANEYSKDADFKSIFAEWKAFRDAVQAWNQINESSYANYMAGVKK
jgi:TRAP-type mannitol/chloroaromatic compound transport system substrate-binding protein